jgi:hypothetical protein
VVCEEIVDSFSVVLADTGMIRSRVDGFSGRVTTNGTQVPEERNMIIRTVVPFLILLAAANAPVAGDDKKPVAKEVGKLDRFEQLKQLAGEWEGQEVGNAANKFTVSYKVTSGGSAIVETIGSGTDHEMVTIIHRDGDDLLLTHYCMLGNQPQMKAPGKGEDEKIVFKFVRATNLKSDKDMYMHDVTYTIVNKDTIKSEWTHYSDGKDSGHVALEMKRKK